MIIEKEMRKIIISYAQIQARKSVEQRNEQEDEWWEMESKDAGRQRGLPATATTSVPGEFLVHMLFPVLY